MLWTYNLGQIVGIMMGDEGGRVGMVCFGLGVVELGLGLCGWVAQCSWCCSSFSGFSAVQALGLQLQLIVASSDRYGAADNGV